MNSSSCVVCYRSYTKSRRSPIVIPCGHTLCLKCLKKIKSPLSFSQTCPNCRYRLRQVDGKMPKNFALITLLEEQKMIEESSPEPSDVEEQEISGALTDLFEVAEQGLAEFTDHEFSLWLEYGQVNGNPFVFSPTDSLPLFPIRNLGTNNNLESFANRSTDNSGQNLVVPPTTETQSLSTSSSDSPLLTAQHSVLRDRLNNLNELQNRLRRQVVRSFQNIDQNAVIRQQEYLEYIRSRTSVHSGNVPRPAILRSSHYSPYPDIHIPILPRPTRDPLSARNHSLLSRSDHTSASWSLLPAESETEGTSNTNTTTTSPEPVRPRAVRYPRIRPTQRMSTGYRNYIIEREREAGPQRGANLTQLNMGNNSDNLDTLPSRRRKTPAVIRSPELSELPHSSNITSLETQGVLPNFRVLRSGFQYQHY